MTNIQRFKSKAVVYPLLAMILTIGVLLIAMVFQNVYPFGDKVMLYADARIQYVGFLGWLGRVLRGDANLFYSFAKSLGGGTFSLFAYYLSSPLNLLTYFFQPEDMPALFSLLIPLKLGLASLTACVYMNKRFEEMNLSSILISSAYGLAACNLVAGSNIMWLDGTIMLPLVCLGVFTCINKKSAALLILSVAITAYSNWYSAYTVCLFSIVYFFAESALTFHGFKVFMRNGLRYMLSMIAGLLLSAPLLLPVILDQLANRASVSTGFIETVASVYPFPQGLADILKNLYMGWEISLPSSGIVVDNFPTASVLFVPTIAFFCAKNSIRLDNKDYKLHKYKIVYGIVIFFLLLSFTCKPLDMIWTAFNRSDSYNPRYTYVLMFCLVIVSGHMFKLLPKQDIPTVRDTLLRTAALICSVGILLIFDGWRPFFKALILQGIIVVLLLLYMFAVSRNDENVLFNIGARGKVIKMYRPVIILLCALLPFCFESLFIKNRQMEALYGDTSFSAYRAYMGELEKVQTVYDLSSSRIENTVTNSRRVLVGSGNLAPTGEEMALGLKGVSHYSSAGKQEVNDLLGSLGYCLSPGFRGIVYYNSPIYPMDMIFGVSNILATDAPYNYSEVAKLQMLSLENEIGILYSTQNALSIGFGVVTDGESFTWTGNSFDNQSLFISDLVGYETNCYIPCEINMPSVSLTGTKLTETITATESGPLYVSVASPAEASFYCNGVFLQTVGGWEFDTNLIYLGTYVEGDSITVALESSAPSNWNNFSIDARILNTGVYNKALDILSDKQLHVDRWEDGVVEGSFTANSGDGLLLTIPYESEWKVLVDGETVEPINYQGLMYISLTEGTHYIQLDYGLPKGMIPGAGIAAATIIGLTSYFLLAKQIRKNSLRFIIEERNNNRSCS